MFKKIIIFSLLFLCSCSNNKHIACILENTDKSITLDINAINDDIVSIKERVVFNLPNDLLADEKRLADLEKQLDESYHFEDNKLVSESKLKLNDTYSYNKTLEYLKKQRYFCE